MLSFAENHEDVVLARALGDEPGGFYVDVGAGSPITRSATRHFYASGWRGINIDPIEHYLAELRAERPSDVNLGVAISADIGEAEFYVVVDCPELSTLDLDRAERYKAGGHSVRTVRVETRSLSSLFAEESPPRIDFLKVDVGGTEGDVLAGLDLSRWRPRVIVAAATAPRSIVAVVEPVDALLVGARYRFVATDGVNRYYLRDEDDYLGPLLVPANSRDQFTTPDEAALETEVERLRAKVSQLSQSLDSAEARANEFATRAADLERVRPTTPVSVGDRRPRAVPPRIDIDRLVIVSSPSTGATQLAVELAGALRAELFRADHPTDVAFELLPDRAVLELCWPRTETVHAMLSSQGFRPVTVIRDPFDTLVAMLADVQSAGVVPAWLDDPTGESDLIGTDPASRQFLDWARSDRACELLGVTASWVDDPSVLKVRFDDLADDVTGVVDQVLELAGLERVAGQMPAAATVRTLSDRADDNDRIRERRSEVLAPRPAWRYLLPAATAGELVAAHAKIFELFGLDLPTDLSSLPEPEVARARWQSIGEGVPGPASS